MQFNLLIENNSIVDGKSSKVIGTEYENDYNRLYKYIKDNKEFVIIDELPNVDKSFIHIEELNDKIINLTRFPFNKYQLYQCIIVKFDKEFIYLISNQNSIDYKNQIRLIRMNYH